MGFLIVGGPAQAGAEFLQAVTVTACGGVRRQAEQLADLLESVPVPELQHDHLALVRRQPGQTTHRVALLVGLLGRPLEPTVRLELPRHPAPERAATVEGAVPERPHDVPLRLLRRDGQVQQRGEDLLHDILRLAVVQSKGPPVQDQTSGLGLIKRLAPASVGGIVDHAF